MALGYDAVEMLVRENQYKPLTGEVVLIGRQTTYFQRHEIIELLREHGYDTSAINPASIALDTNTLNRRKPYDTLDIISDYALFKLLGVPNVRALDHSDYEGADIIHDLTKPLPEKLKNFADFVVDGGTLDNTFSPGTTIKNLADLLKPGGRIMTINQYSNHHNPYVLLHPLWYLDYFTMNQFVDCKLYIIVYNAPGMTSNNVKCHTNVFCINLDYLLDKNREVSTFVSDHEMMIIMLAERGEHSTTDIFPSQQHYRLEDEWETYRRNLSVIAGSPRPHLIRSQGPITLHDARGGHLFMGSDFTARDPMTESKRMGYDPSKPKDNAPAKRGVIKLLGLK